MLCLIILVIAIIVLFAFLFEPPQEIGSLLIALTVVIAMITILCASPGDSIIHKYELSSIGDNIYVIVSPPTYKVSTAYYIKNNVFIDASYPVPNIIIEDCKPYIYITTSTWWRRLLYDVRINSYIIHCPKKNILGFPQ